MHPNWFFYCIILHTAILDSMAANTCPKSGTTLTSPSDSITDGAGAYSANMDCSWIIAPTGCSAVSISFSQFDLEQGHDTLTISSCYDKYCFYPTVIATLSGYTIPTSITTGQYVQVHFQSDSTVNYAGFTLTYSGDSSCMPAQLSASSAYTSCTNKKPVNSIYTASGSGSADCSWRCSSGFTGEETHAMLWILGTTILTLEVARPARINRWTTIRITHRTEVPVPADAFGSVRSGMKALLVDPFVIVPPVGACRTSIYSPPAGRRGHVPVCWAWQSSSPSLQR